MNFLLFGKLSVNIQRKTALSLERKEKICALLKSIETGDTSAVSVVNEHQYIQHNPQTKEGGEGLAELFKRLSKSSPKVNIVRIFSDGDFVFGHTEYDFGSPKVGFEIFRFEDEQAVEHWDNIQPRKGPNVSGHSMVDGERLSKDEDKTEENRTLVEKFINEVLLEAHFNELPQYVSESYIEHNPEGQDGLQALQKVLLLSKSNTETNTQYLISKYKKLHRVLADGNFVLTVCEGQKGEALCSLYDLFRVHQGKIVEHWDTVEIIPPKSEWKNQNGKF